MFEAHNYYADDLLPQVDAEPQQPTVLPELHLIHQHYQCPLYIWFAGGKRKDGRAVPHDTWYIHIEYRQADGSHGYHLLERRHQNTIDPALWQELTELELPGICPQQTRLRPVKCGIR